MLDQSEETQNNSHQSDGPNLDISQRGKTASQRSSPGIFSSKEIISQKILRLSLNFL
jgi:hypothetical protein